MSVPPPVANGVTMRTVFSGYFCAAASDRAAVRAMATNTPDAIHAVRWILPLTLIPPAQCEQGARFSPRAGRGRLPALIVSPVPVSAIIDHSHLCLLARRDDAVPQNHLGLLESAFDDVAGLDVEIFGVRFPDGDAAGGARGEHVARREGNETREVLDDVRQLPDLIARVDAHPLLAVHAARDPDVVRIGDFVHR